MRDVGRTQEEFVNRAAGEWFTNSLRVFYQHPKWFISSKTIETCGLLLKLYNNSVDARFFPWVYQHNNAQLIDQSERAL